jgi:bifunctional UDP-N-acetylglucosamine pyrophosphorylase/glucosamine-1-phosphate N-acetyltransferase
MIMQAKFRPTIIILAAGNGERMKSSTPKILHTIASKPMIEYVLELAKSFSQHDSDICVVINQALKDDEQFQEIAKRHVFDAVIQEKRLGTGDAVRTAYNSIRNVNELVLILYGDTPFIKTESIDRMFEQIANGADLAIIGFNAKNPTGYGRIISGTEGMVDEIVEEKEATEEQRTVHLCNSGIMLIKKDALADFLNNNSSNNPSNSGEVYLTDIALHLSKKSKTCAYILAYVKEVMGINDRNQLSIAEEYMQKIIRNELMSGGVTIIKPETSYFAKNIDASSDVTIYPNVFIGKDTVIKSGAIIHSFSHIEGAILEEGAVVGPFARIRPKTKIGKGSKIGNFVEVKNSTLMENVKASHLSYIGDATIHNDVNIGAGTVFCNYDGSKKHHSEVGEKSFIGSNTSIISPVSIGSKSTIAAGSVITKNVEENDLAVSRPPQINLKNKSKVK